MAHSELWNALGLQISKSLRSQLGITIPGLGQFGFVAPEIPIFIPVSSLSLKPCILEEGSFKPYSGTIFTHSTLNTQKLSSDLKISSESAKNLLETVLSSLKDKTNSDFKQEIPHVGWLLIKNKNVAVQFSSFSNKFLITEDAAT